MGVANVVLAVYLIRLKGRVMSSLHPLGKTSLVDTSLVIVVVTWVVILVHEFAAESTLHENYIRRRHTLIFHDFASAKKVGG
jgi:hypothetical protein